MKKDEILSASNAVRKFITTFYKDVDFYDVVVNNNIYEIPYIIIWYNQKDPEDRRDYINFRHRIIDDIEDYKRELEEWERRQEEKKWKSQSQKPEAEEELSDIDKLKGSK